MNIKYKLLVLLVAISVSCNDIYHHRISAYGRHVLTSYFDGKIIGYKFGLMLTSIISRP